jgi:nicotinate-nucleotide pyrophosphorylase (carboxylating)
MILTPPPAPVVDSILRSALAEDLGQRGDITTDAIVPAEARARGAIIARAPGRIAGLSMALQTFELIDQTMSFELLAEDGDEVTPGQILTHIDGPARAILTGERVALNLLGRLSGIASATAAFVNAVQGTGARILCTRKTTPGLRALEKYAVRAGGGCNHRFGLDDAVLIKDNHIAIAGGVAEAIERVRLGSSTSAPCRIQVEVDDLTQLDEALVAGVDAVLLDNMDIPSLTRAVAVVNGRATTEASGGITLDTAAAIAGTGVDYLSIGWLTHSAPALDVGLDITV